MQSLQKVLGFIGFIAIALTVAFLPSKALSLNNPVFIAAAVCSGLLIVFSLASIKRSAPQSSTHGSAGWASEHDVKTLLADPKLSPAPGSLILGEGPKPAGASAVFLTPKRLDIPLDLALRHTLVLGPTGSGKTRTFYLWQLANFIGSLLYSDPKSEGWKLTSGCRKNPKRFAPLDPDNSEPFNWIPDCGHDPTLCYLLSQTIVLNSQAQTGGQLNPFYTTAGASFLTAVFSHASTFRTPTPAACYDFLIAYNIPSLIEALLHSESETARDYGKILYEGKEATLGEIVRGARIALRWLADPKIRRFTSSAAIGPDFGRMRREHISAYWCLDETRAAVLQPLSAIFFALALFQIKHAEGSAPVIFLLDEFANIGAIPAFRQEITVLRGRGIGLALGVQSIAQLEAVYGKAESQIILGNLATKIVYGGLDYDSAEYVSKSLGEMTGSEERKTETRQGGVFGKASLSTTIATTRRRLLTADEVRRLEKDEQIVFCDNLRPIKSARYWYDKQPMTAKAKPLPQALPSLFPPPECDE